MSEETKYMDLGEAREMGVIHEINRRLLHPRGLALSVECEMDDDGNVEEVNDIVGIVDYREHKEGLVFSKPDEEKLERFDELLNEEERRDEYGFIVQPADETFDFDEEESDSVSKITEVRDIPEIAAINKKDDAFQSSEE